MARCACWWRPRPAGLPRVNEIGIDGTVLLFTLGVALLASLLFGCIPIFKYAGSRLAAGLREGARGASQSREQHRTRSVLVVVQVALALVLLICSGLMARTFVALTRVQPGFTAPEEIQTFQLSIPKAVIAEDENVARQVRRKSCTRWRRCQASRQWAFPPAFRWMETTATIPFLPKTRLTVPERSARCAASSSSRPASSRPWALRWSPAAT